MKSSPSMSSLTSVFTMGSEADPRHQISSANSTLRLSERIFTISGNNSDSDSVYSDSADSGTFCDSPHPSQRHFTDTQAKKSSYTPKFQKSSTAIRMPDDRDKPTKMTRTQSNLSIMSATSINIEEDSVLNWTVSCLIFVQLQSSFTLD